MDGGRTKGIPGTFCKDHYSITSVLLGSRMDEEEKNIVQGLSECPRKVT